LYVPFVAPRRSEANVVTSFMNLFDCLICDLTPEIVTQARLPWGMIIRVYRSDDFNHFCTNQTMWAEFER
jgi:hypothetical protein